MKINQLFKIWLLLFLGQSFSVILIYTTIYSGNNELNKWTIKFHLGYFLFYTLIISVIYFINKYRKNGK